MFSDSALESLFSWEPGAFIVLGVRNHGLHSMSVLTSGVSLFLVSSRQGKGIGVHTAHGQRHI